MSERQPTHETEGAEKTCVVKLLKSGDMYTSVVLSSAGKSYRVDEHILTDEPVFSDYEMKYPIDPDDPLYVGQHLAGSWRIFEVTPMEETESASLVKEIDFDIGSGLLGCLMDVVPGSRWYRAGDEQQYILDSIMRRIKEEIDK